MSGHFVSAVFLVGFCVSLVLFASGFFLSRVEFSDKSTCSPLLHESSHVSGQDRCWMAPRYNRAVVLLVDALRFDFIAPSHLSAKVFGSLAGHPEVAVYRDNMHFIHELIDRRDGRALLVPFLADPPTVTFQRLKGLTTGSMPTFFDVSSSFVNPAISEDNWIVQMSSTTARGTVFAGDDTWTQIYPHAYTDMYPYPSFNVWDLHTVDNGVLEVLLPLLNASATPLMFRGPNQQESYDKTMNRSVIGNMTSRGKDWKLFVGHFLGVDHVGHHHHSEHAEMPLKLRQLDEVLKSVIASIPNDTILIVIGDHGMTAEGNHGGSTAEEVTSSALFYAPAGVTRSGFDFSDDIVAASAVQQVDIVPTLSLLLGAPIPFSSIGKMIPHLKYNLRTSNSTLEEATAMVTAMRHNARQVYDYISKYQATTGAFPASTMDNLKLESQFESAMGTAAEYTPADNLSVIATLLRFLAAAQDVCRQSWTQFNVVMITWGCVGFGFVALITTIFVVFPTPSASHFGYCFVVTSIVVIVLQRIVVTVLSLLWPSMLSSAANIPVLPILPRSLAVVLTYPEVFPLGGVIVIALGVASAASVWSAAKRQSFMNWITDLGLSWVGVGLFVMRVAALTSNSFIVEERSVLMYLSTTFSMVWLYRGYAAGLSGRTLTVYGLGMFTFGRLAFELCFRSIASSSVDSIGLMLGSAVSLLPLTLSLCLQVDTGAVAISSIAMDVVSAAALVVYWSETTTATLLLPRIVYFISLIRLIGVAVTFRAKHSTKSIALACFCALFPVVLMLTDCRRCLGLGCDVVQALALLYLLTKLTKASSHHALHIGDALVHWTLIGSFHFYSTGHAMVYSAIDFNSAFIGVTELWLPRACVMVLTSTFATSFLHTMFAPVIALLAPRRGSFVPCCLSVLFLSCVVILMCCVFTSLQRRHLMTWSIFAPKLTFELCCTLFVGVAFAVVCTIRLLAVVCRL